MVKRRDVLGQLGGVLGLMAGWLSACAGDRSAPVGASQPASSISLKSSAFSANGFIPVQYTCDGPNHSPALSWENIPDQTRSLVLVVEDPDAPGRTFTHWIIYDMPATLQELPENLPAQPFLSIGGVQAKSDFGRYGYGGPCPPSGTHRYLFKLYALDQVLDLPPGTSKAEVFSAMQNHILATGELMGRYSRQR